MKGLPSEDHRPSAATRKASRTADGVWASADAPVLVLVGIRLQSDTDDA